MPLVVGRSSSSSPAPAAGAAAAGSSSRSLKPHSEFEEKEAHDTIQHAEGKENRSPAASKKMNPSTPGKSASSNGSSTKSPAASSAAKKPAVWSDDEDEVAPRSDGSELVRKKREGSSGEMTLEAIRALCKGRKDLYENLELNDKLFLNFGGFKSLQNLQQFPQLKSLWLENNCLTSLQPQPPALSTGLDALTALRCLYLQNNQLSSLDGIEVLHALVLLNVSSNALHNLQGIAGLQHLQIVDAHDNRIDEVSVLKEMKGHKFLHTLDLSQNALTAPESAEDIPPNQVPMPEVFDILAGLPNLKVLYLKHNPLVESVGQYRRVLSSALPSLSFLDDRPVTALDRACAAAWKEGGKSSEVLVRNSGVASKREKDERNFAEWMKRKEERVAQLAEMRKANAEAASAASAEASSSASAPSSDPALVKRTFHASSAPIPASPYHPAIPAVEYNSWLLRSEAVEEEDAAEREREQLVQAEMEREEKLFAAAAAVSLVAPASAASSSSSSSAPAEELSKASYLKDDSSDDPEIRALKSMLADVMLSTQAMRMPRRRAQNPGVSEAALVDESQLQAQEDAAQSASAKSATPVLNLVAEAVRPSKTVTAAVEESFEQGEPNDFSVLQERSIADIYAAAAKGLPSVGALSDHEDDESDVDSAEEEGADAETKREIAAGLASPVKSPKSPVGSRNKMPAILGFGPNDRHLIERPFFGGAGAGAFGGDDVSESLAEEDWEPTDANSASTSSAPASKPGTTLADLLESRRAARIGASAAKASVAPLKQVPRRQKPAPAALLAEGDAPSSTATGMTAEALLASFIAAQNNPSPSPASSSAGGVSSKPDIAPAHEARQARFEREQKQELFMVASERAAQESDEENESEQEDEDGEWAAMRCAIA